MATNLWNAGKRWRRRPLREERGFPHLHHHHQNAGRRHERERHLDGSDRSQARWAANAAAVARTRNRASHDRRRQERRLHAGLRLAHLRGASPTIRWLARSIHAQSTNGCSAPVIRCRIPPSKTSLLLDSVMDDARQLRQQLGGADRQRMDEYLSVVRSLEQRLDRASRPGRSAWKPRVADRRRRTSRPTIPRSTPSTCAGCWT